MKYFALLLLAGVASASVNEMLSSNRVALAPAKTQDAHLEETPTCTECQSIVRRFRDSLENPERLAELKVLLGALCHETVYLEECKFFVANLDKFIQKLKPFLADEKQVCHTVRLCGNPSISQMHRIGLAFASKYMSKIDGMKDFACDECQFAAVEVKKVIEDPAVEKKTRDFVSANVCAILGKLRGSCDLMLEEFLPEFFAQLKEALQNPKDTCGRLGFCQASRRGVARKNTALGRQRAMQQWTELVRGGGRDDASFQNCALCQLVANLLITTMYDASQGLSNLLQDVACGYVLPKNFTAGCDDFLTRYGYVVVQMTAKQFNAENLCTSLSFCPAPPAPSSSISKQSACKGCAQSMVVLRDQLARDSTADSVAAVGIESVCRRYLPHMAQPLCEDMMEGLGVRFVRTARRLVAREDSCSLLC